MPFRTDNALVTAAEVIRRIAGFEPPAVIHDVWRRFVEASDLPPELGAALLDPASLERFVDAFDDAGMARSMHAVTHTTMAPTMVSAGTKTNVIPDAAEIQLDIRTLPGQTGQDILASLRNLLGDLFENVDVEIQSDDGATASPLDTPLWASLSRVTAGLVDGAALVPQLLVAATDARFFRRLGSTAYGFGLYSERMTSSEFLSMFHGHDERVDQESLRLSTELWYGLAHDLLG